MRLTLSKIALTFLTGFCASTLRAQIPQYDHVVVVIDENHNFNEIIGSSAAPYINSLAAGSALFTGSHATEHPSQPNYLDLYSGFNQGVVADDTSPLAPFNTGNLGASLLNSGRTFADFSESLPFSLASDRRTAVAPNTPGATAYGYLGDSYSASNLNEYMRKHNPSSNWQNEANPGANQLPATTNQPFTAFPKVNFSLLPTVSFVIPNEQNDMHDGSIAMGDTWLSMNIDAYRQWAMTHNSLLILTFDEGSEDPNSAVDGIQNRVVTLFSGDHIITGQYSELITHFNVLRTLDAMYGLTPSGADSTATPITDVFAVPEPSSVILVAVGGMILLLCLQRRQRFFRALLLPVAAGTLFLAVGNAPATVVVSPGDLATATGDTGNLFPFFPGAGTAVRYQQVFSSTDFSAFASGGETITQIAFRPNADSGFAFAGTVPSIQISLSTTSATLDNLSLNFADNSGADATVVYPMAPLALASSFSGPASGPKAFDIIIQLVTPFHYDPANGNLLLEIQNFNGGDSLPMQVELDGSISDTDTTSRLVASGPAGSATATTADFADSYGLATQFSSVPEPSSMILITLATLPFAVLLRRRK